MKIEKIINTGQGGQLYIRNGRQNIVVHFVSPETAEQAYERYRSSVKFSHVACIHDTPEKQAEQECKSLDQRAPRKRRRKNDCT